MHRHVHDNVSASASAAVSVSVSKYLSISVSQWLLYLCISAVGAATEFQCWRWQTEAAATTTIAELEQNLPSDDLN